MINKTENTYWVDILLLLLLVLAIGAIFALPEATQALQFDSSAIMNGELWRLFTGHVTHWDMDHLIWDLAGLVIAGVLCLRINRKHTWLMILISPVILSLFTLVAHTDIRIYRGLSGIDSALGTYACIHFIVETYKEKNYRACLFFIGIVIAFIFKLTYEHLSDGGLFVQSTNFDVMPTIHILGALIGGGLLGCYNHFNNTDSHVREKITSSKWFPAHILCAIHLLYILVIWILFGNGAEKEATWIYSFILVDVSALLAGGIPPFGSSNLGFALYFFITGTIQWGVIGYAIGCYRYLIRQEKADAQVSVAGESTSAPK